MLERFLLGRRGLLAGGAAMIGAMGGGTRATAQQSSVDLPDYVSWKDPAALILHSNNTIEMERWAFGTAALTPENKLFVRNNVAPPPESILENRDTWEIRVEGVAEPQTLTLASLKTMGIKTVAMVLQCSGNGRAYFDHEPSGTPWEVGAAGCVMWTGVPLRSVIDALGGPADGAEYVTGTGGETLPDGIDPLTLLVERSVPLDALDDILLAWDMNGEPISLAHGGPLRMVVPGFTGVNSVKYVTRVAMTEEQSPALIQQSRYRLQPVGETGGPEHPSVWRMGVKSWITGPLEATGAGQTQVTGVAFGGTKDISSVEISVDDGKTWVSAEFIGPDLGKFAWRPFVAQLDLSPGNYRLVSRATDADGSQQPEQTEPNDAGYNHNGWRAPGVEIEVA